jgi:hypothetical protein
MTDARSNSFSEMVRETVERALDLERQARLLREFFARRCRKGRQGEGGGELVLQAARAD